MQNRRIERNLYNVNDSSGMKRVLCLTDAFSLGGAERQLIGLAHLLQKNGYIVDLACYIDKNFYKDIIEEYGLNCILLRPRGKLEKLLVVHHLIKSKKYDSVIAYKDGAAIIVALLKMFGLKSQVIVSERNTTQALTIKTKCKFWLYRFVDRIVPNSHSQYEFIKTKYPQYTNKLFTITNFTDIRTFCPADIAKVNNKFVNIIIAGRIAQQKNIIRFLNVVKRLKDTNIHVHFKWFGNVSANAEKYESVVLSKHKSMKLEDIIEFLPATNNIKEEYQKCDAFCLPSLYEGYPNVVCEAMSCGKPILCSNVCDNSYIINAECGFMFDPKDEQDMFKTISKFCTLSKEHKRSMGIASRRIAERTFSEDVFVQKYIKLIECNET